MPVLPQIDQYFPQTGGFSGLTGHALFLGGICSKMPGAKEGGDETS